MLTQKKIALPCVKSFTIKDLRKIEVPTFQRWIVAENLVELKNSIDEVGLLRCPVICFVKEHEREYIIDGNHIRNVLTEKGSGYQDSEIINCIYKEVDSYAEAANFFKMLNTKGKNLDWIDITNLYMHTIDGASIYKDLWAILGHPSTHSDIRKTPGFSIATIVEFLAKDKRNYRIGKGEKRDDYFARKSLINYLLAHANISWDIKFPTNVSRKPNGGAVIGFSNYWFKEGLHRKYDHADQAFLDVINEIYLEKQVELQKGLFVISRDNAAVLMKDYIERM